MAGLENLRILIAEDHALVRQGIAALIALEAGEVVEAEDGERALHLLKTEAFDIALIDIGLPGLMLWPKSEAARSPLKSSF